MERSAQIKEAFGRNAKAMALRPSVAQGTAKTKVTLWGAKLGVAFTRLEVEVQADYDSRPNHGVTTDPPGYRQVRYIVTVESDAPEADVMRVLDQADQCSPLRDDFSRALDVRREVKFTT